MMSGQEKGLRTPLKRMRGLGSAKEGVGHWWQTRLTSLALVPLTLWFVLSILALFANCTVIKQTIDPSDPQCGPTYRNVLEWVSHPLDALLLILLTVIMFMHAASGMQAVFEDYIHKEGRKLLAIYSVKAVCLLLGGACVLCILKIALGHP